VAQLLWVPAFFALRVASALFLLKLSASFLPVSGFTVFSQLVTFASMLGVLALCGAQNGVIRQAAAARDHAALLQTQSAAFAIWATAAPAALLLALLGRDFASTILVGSAHEGGTVLAIVAIVVAGAPGGIWCALLSGRQRTAQSLSAQAAGLICGAAAAAWRITRHDPAGAALAFAGGLQVTACIALPLALRLGLPLVPRPSRWPPVRTLLRYSAAFAFITGYAGIVLFGLRWFYREHFGATQLGYWLVAGRISDMSTQLVGLFMIQVFVPHLAASGDQEARRAFLVRSWAAAVAVMCCALVAFFLASGRLIHLLLSDVYLPATSVILTCMVGDIFRVWPSIAMHTALAKGQPLRYAGMEAGALTVMAVIGATLTAAGVPTALQTGYVAAYAIAAGLVSAVFLHRRRRAAPAIA
jgi:hypothetical protein